MNFKTTKVEIVGVDVSEYIDGMSISVEDGKAKVVLNGDIEGIFAGLLMELMEPEITKAEPEPTGLRLTPTTTGGSGIYQGVLEYSNGDEFKFTVYACSMHENQSDDDVYAIMYCNPCPSIPDGTVYFWGYPAKFREWLMK